MSTSPDQKIDDFLPSSGTRAHSPDMDWSQVRETILMLGLAITQIRDAMTQGEDSVGTLTRSFTELAGQVTHIESVTRELPGMPEETRADLMHRLEKTRLSVTESIVAFQFYDRLSQRLDHVCHSIDALGALIAVPQRLFNPGEWVSLQQLILSRYTMEEERAMFEMVMRGVPISEALATAKARISSRTSSDDDIELF